MSEKIKLQAGIYELEQTQFGPLYKGAIMTNDGQILKTCASSSITWARNDLGIEYFENADGPTERYTKEVHELSDKLGTGEWEIIWSKTSWLPNHLISIIMEKVKN